MPSILWPSKLPYKHKHEPWSRRGISRVRPIRGASPRGAPRGAHLAYNRILQYSDQHHEPKVMEALGDFYCARPGTEWPASELRHRGSRLSSISRVFEWGVPKFISVGRRRTSEGNEDREPCSARAIRAGVLPPIFATLKYRTRRRAEGLVAGASAAASNSERHELVDRGDVPRDTLRSPTLPAGGSTHGREGPRHYRRWE